MTTVESSAGVDTRGFDLWFWPEPICGWLTPSRRQLQKVVDRADQRPFTGDLADPAQQELAKPTGLLDLTEHRFHRLLSQPIATAVPTATKLLPYRIGVSAQLDLSLSHGGRFPMFLTAGGNVAVHVTPPKLLEIVFRTIAGIGRQFPSLSPHVLFNLGYHRRQLLGVGSVVGKPLRHDHLAISIDGSLNIVRLNKPVVAFHDPALGIGEVRLRLTLGRAGLVLARPTRTAPFLPCSFLGCLRLGFGFQSSARLSNLFQPLLLIVHPLGQLLAAALCPVLLIISKITGLGLLKPAADDRLKLRLAFLHPPV